jgi:hypothetical protein
VCVRVCVCVAETRSPRESRVPSEICSSAGMDNCSIMFVIIFDDVLRAAVCVTLPAYPTFHSVQSRNVLYNLTSHSFHCPILPHIASYGTFQNAHSNL